MTSTQTIPADHACFAGHFPGQPILPGVLLLSRVLEAAQAQLTQPLHHCVVNNVKFSAAVLPGAEIAINLDITSSVDVKFTVHIVSDASLPPVLACSGQLRIVAA
jgi:3-hydroxymyristoyl/3-hydroxydecanoyl-(acyl carrier protein) dehydratase